MAERSIPDIPTLEGVGVRLRPWTHDDIDAVIAAGRDPFIAEITTVPAGCDEAQAHEFVDRQIGRPESDQGHARVIADHDTDEAIGHLFTSLLFVRVGRAEMGYWVLPDKRRRGAASEALDLAATWVLANTAVRRVTLHIEPWNAGSIGVARRAGFREDGLLRGWDTYDDGEPRDMLSFGRLRGDR